MEFKKAVHLVQQNICKKLPGGEAHSQMMPIGRVLSDKNKNSVKQTGVCILLYPEGEKAYSVLIERTTYNGVHSGQIGLPGGKKEETDKDLIFTALRETEEEIGVCKEDIQIIDSLSQLYIPPSQFLVHPVIAYVDYKPEFLIDTAEVKTLILYDIENLIKDFEIKIKVFSGLNYTIEAPCFEINAYSVWGATAMMLNEFRMLLLDN